MGVNVNDQLFIKTELEDEVLGGANPPAILIDTNGDVYINGQPQVMRDGIIYFTVLQLVLTPGTELQFQQPRRPISVS